MSNSDGPVPQAVRCGNGHILGMRIGPVVIIKHDRRTYVGTLLYAQCKCGGTWISPEHDTGIRNALDGLKAAWDTADLPELPE